MLRSLALTLFLFCSSLASAQSFGPVRFLHLQGRLSGADPSAILAAVDAVFSAPLRQSSSNITHSSIALVSEQGDLNFNLIAEAISPAGIAQLEKFISYSEEVGFKGLVVHFQNVKQISEHLDLQIGQYKPEDPDAFESSFEISQERNFTSLSDWEDFNNHLGFSLMDKSDVFIHFLKEFTPPEAFENEVIPQLEKNNMVEMPTLSSLILEDGTIIGPQVGEGPILPFIYGRNCWSKEYEHGNCK